MAAMGLRTATSSRRLRRSRNAKRQVVVISQLYMATVEVVVTQ
jgi:hypothetical protein